MVWTPAENTDFENPFLGGFNKPKIQWIDWDGDQDDDLFLLDEDGCIKYFENKLVEISEFELISTNFFELSNISWFFIGDFKQYEWLVIFLVSGLFVTCGLYLFNPHLIWYVGLSGLLHGLFLAGGLRLLATEFKFAAVLIIAIVGKLMYEQMMGSLPGTSEMSGGPVVVNSHLFGAIGGVVSFILLWIVGKLGGTKNAGEMSE